MLKKLFVKIKKSFGKNFWPKAVALLIATILWMVVASSQSTLGKFPGTIPVRANNVPGGLAAIFDQNEVEIEIMAEPAVWNKLSESSFSAYVDLGGLKEGTYELEVKVVSNEEGVTITKISPNKILVRLESIITKNLPVSPKIQGNATEGLVPGNIDITPNEVSVSGPASQINKISEVNIVVQLNGESNDFERLEKVVVFGTDGKEIETLMFNPSEVSAKVSLVKASNNKTVGVKVKTTGTPKEGYYVSKVSVNPSVVDITGSIFTLRNINFIETDPIDISGRDKDLERDVFLNLPTNIALQRGQVSKVSVVIGFSEDKGSKVVVLKIEPVNLSNNLRFSYSPLEIKAVLIGSQNLLSGITSSDVYYSLDLSNKSQGSYNYELSQDKVIRPENVEVSSIVPSSISVVLELK